MLFSLWGTGIEYYSHEILTNFFPFLVWRGYFARLKFTKIRNAALILQRRWRSFRAKARILEFATIDDPQEVTLTEHKSVSLVDETHLPLHVNTGSMVLSSWFMPFVHHGYGVLLQKPTVMDYHIDRRIERGQGIASLRRVEQVRLMLLCLCKTFYFDMFTHRYEIMSTGRRECAMPIARPVRYMSNSV